MTGTAVDFRVPKAIGTDIENTGLAYPGYDHNFILNGREKETFAGHELDVAAVCSVPERKLTVLTDMPCLQIYTANFLGTSSYPFKVGHKQLRHIADFFETHYAPDSPSRGEARLNPGEQYHKMTVFKLA